MSCCCSPPTTRTGSSRATAAIPEGLDPALAQKIMADNPLRPMFD